MYFFQQTDVIFTDLVYIRVCHKSVCHHKLYYFRRRIIAQPWIILILVRDFFRDFFRAQFCMAKSHEENSNICMILYYWKGIIIRKMFRFMNNALVFGSLAVAASLLWWPQSFMDDPCVQSAENQDPHLVSRRIADVSNIRYLWRQKDDIVQSILQAVQITDWDPVVEHESGLLVIRRVISTLRRFRIFNYIRVRLNCQFGNRLLNSLTVY